MSANLVNLLERAARAYPRQPAVALGGQVWCDYATLAERVTRLSTGFRVRLGLQSQDRVALVMRNCPHYVEMLFACWHAGLTAVPINATLHPKELAFIFQDSCAAACFVTAEHAADAAQAQQSSPLLREVIDVASNDYAQLLGAANDRFVERETANLAWFFYTSGTTGKPKGVMLTQRNLLALTHNYFSDVDHIAAGDSILHAAPMSHGSGLYILPHVAQAACNVIPESGGFDPTEIFGLLRAHRGVTLFAAPTMVKRLVDRAEIAAPDLGNLKTVVYGGGPMYVADIRRAMAVMGPRFAQIYGQGESPMTITAMSKALHADADEVMLASVGLPFTGVEVRIADREDRWLHTGEIGEVLVRGDTVMAGYLNNPDASTKTLAHGWLHTGDIGCVDARGFLALKDRSKDVIISGGSNIYPREVEEVLLTHPAVAEASVIGVSDAEWGERVVAFVVGRGAVGAEELERLCLDSIARFKRPKRYVFVDALPKNAAGKVLKTELRDLL
ncbi:MAG: AMP-binding protein [Sterolibacterium sp.]|jgi:long-chain acyl-CoA synthetase